jgi:acyl-CoA thioester hydrolase
VHEKRIDIRWADLDGFGHVNQAVYLTFAEEVLDDWFRRKLGLPPGSVWDYVAARNTLDYRAELRQTDLQAVGSVSLVKLGTKSITLKITLSAPDGRLATEIESVVVVVDGKGGPSRALTDAERQALEAAD